MRTAPPEDLRLLLALGLLGVLVFAAGLGLAHHNLPEWRAAPMPAPGPLAERFHELSGRLSFRPGSRPLQQTLATQAAGADLVCAPRRPEDPPFAQSYGVCAEVRQEGKIAGDDQTRELSILFSREGEPRAVVWLRSQILLNMATENPVASRQLIESFTSLLTGPGERLGPPRSAIVSGAQTSFHDVTGSSPPEHLRVYLYPGGHLIATREHGTAAEAVTHATSLYWGRVVRGVFRPLFILSVFVLFLVLAGKRHVDVTNGAILAGVTLLTFLPELLTHGLTLENLLVQGMWVVVKVLWVFLLWSAGESFLRSYQPNFTTSLDALRAWRLGPRGSRALLVGLAMGLVLAGLRLWLLSLASLSPLAWPIEGSLSLPLASLWKSSVGQSFVLAATVMLVLAAAYRLLPARWAPAAAVVLVPLCLPLPLRLNDFWIELVAGLLLAAVLIWVLRAFGLTALLTTTVAFYLWPAAVYSGLNLEWIPAAFAGSAGTLAAILALGLAGLGRPESIEAQRLQPPAFMRRIEGERRLRYEMDLLARMQEGLLPPVPEVPGWQIAARSLLATEAGGDLYDFLFDEEGHLWVAVGDVAGHGYSCAIVQAMTTAALTSVIRPGMMPSEVLLHVDRVIRRGGSARNFASLTLMRLDPRTGEVVLSNAGHPFPLHILDEDVSEIVLPGLPLGKGPARRYLDVTLHLPAGSALVFCSDGLMETHDWQRDSYGFERPQEVLRGATEGSAEEILEHLLTDWRRHLGSEEPPDDTTIVVVKRAG